MSGVERVPFSPGGIASTGSDLLGRERFLTSRWLGLPLAALLTAACASSSPTPSPTETLPPVRATVTPIPIGGGDRLVCDPQGVIVREDGKTPATPFPTEAQIRKFNSCVIAEAQKAVTQRAIEQIGVPQKDKNGKETYPEGSIIRNFQLLASSGIPSSLPEGYAESQRQGINGGDILELQNARRALESGDIKKAKEIIANEVAGIKFTSETALRRYPNLGLDANNNGVVDWLELVSGQVSGLERELKTIP